MAATLPRGTVLRGPTGQIAIRMGEPVTAGSYLVVDPDAGGYYAGLDSEVERIESWPQMAVAEPAE